MQNPPAATVSRMKPVGLELGNTSPPTIPHTRLMSIVAAGTPKTGAGLGFLWVGFRT